MFYSLLAAWQLRRASREGAGYKDYWQAGKSVAGIDKVEPVKAVMERFMTEFARPIADESQTSS